MACEEDKLTENTNEQTPLLDAGSASNEDENKYERLEYSFRGNLNLKEDLFISAKHIYFRQGSNVKINNLKLILEAESISFDKDSSIAAFNSNEYAPCKTNGKDSGFVEVYANSILGSPLIDLAGQHAGQIGFYKDSSLTGPIESSHKTSKSGYYLGCGTYVKGKYPKDVPHLFVPKTSGKAGAFLVEAKDYSEFKPLISNRRPHGSFASLIEGHGGKISWWREAPKGSDGQPGEVCFKVSEDYLCK